MKNNEDSGFAILLGFFATPLLAMWTAYVVTILWAWFVVPLGLPVIGKAHAYGLVVLVALIRARAPRKDEASASIAATIMTAILGPAVGLLAGWIAHSLMGGA